MSKKTVTPNALCDAVQDIIKEYSDEVVNKMPEIVKGAAKTTVKALKKNADAIGGTKYRSSFKSKKSSALISGETTYTVYSTQYRLTHLLEHGHVIRNRAGGPVYGMARAFPHWRPAEQEGIDELNEKIREAIEG